MNSAKVSITLNNRKKRENKESFDYLSEFKESIESNLGLRLSWNRLDEKNMSSIDCKIENINLKDKTNWAKIAKFHAEMSHKFYNEFVPILKSIPVSDVIITEK